MYQLLSGKSKLSFACVGKMRFSSAATSAFYIFKIRTSAFYPRLPQGILELELDGSADPSHPTDNNGEESYSLYISPFVSKMAI